MTKIFEPPTSLNWHMLGPTRGTNNVKCSSQKGTRRERCVPSTPQKKRINNLDLCPKNDVDVDDESLSYSGYERAGG